MNIYKAEKKTQKNRRTRKPPHIKQALCLVSILSLIIAQAGALLLRPVPVLASEGAAAYNVAGYILSLLTSYNTAITNQQVVNSIVTTFGNMDCASASAAQIETGLASIAQSTGFDLAPIFATSAEEAAAVAAVYEEWGEAAIAAASAGTNIEAGAKGLALAAAGGAGAAVLPVVGGVILPATAAVGLGIAGGFLIDHIRNSIMNYVKNGAALNTNPSVVANIADGVAIIPFTNLSYAYSLLQGNLRICNYHSTNGLCWRTVDGGPYGIGRQIIGRNQEWFTVDPTGPSDPNAIGNAGIWELSALGYPVFDTWQEVQEYLLGSDSPNIYHKQNNMSPDIVGNNGNQTGVQDGNNYRLPYVQPIYNYGNTVINYINPSDYNDLVSQANTNTGNGDVDEETQGVDFDTFVNPYIQPITDPDPDPDPDPNPTSVPQPTSVPIVGVNPVPDPQPTSAPLPTPSPEEEEQLPEGMTNPDWKEKFPFCIPYDLLAFMEVWQEAREAPRFEFDLSFGTNGRYGLGVVVIDLSPFDSAAQLLRLLQLILFIVGLAIGTHKLLNPSGGGGD